MGKANDTRAKMMLARNELATRARAAAEDDYTRSVASRIEMEACNGHADVNIEASKAGLIALSAYFERMAELAELDGYHTEYLEVSSLGPRKLRISWATSL